MVEVKLRDGSRVRLRPIRKDDVGGMVDLFHRFSEETIQQRFFESIEDMTEEKAQYYVNVDYKDTYALVAELPRKKQLIGVARYMGSDGEAEFAIVIADEWQNRGLGTIMFKHLIRIARENGLKKLIGIVYKSNPRMIHIIEKTGLHLTVSEADRDALEFELRL
ncbi:MAG: GNAT family N-acetyltransferase [Candidatus Altiarchaeota archaeon]